MKTLIPIQKEIVTALEQMKEKSLITEANLAKKVRENAKISGKNKAGICLKDRNRQSKPKFTQRKTIQLQDAFILPLAARLERRNFNVSGEEFFPVRCCFAVRSMLKNTA